MADAMDILDLPTPAIIKPIELWTGKQLFSVLLRPDANMRVYLNLTLTKKSYTKPSGKKVKPYETMCLFKKDSVIVGFSKLFYHLSFFISLFYFVSLYWTRKFIC